LNESDLIPYVATLEIPARRVLVVAPHPDDEVFGCAGAIASHLRHGVSVQVLVLTDGSKHGNDQIRAEECARAAAVLGYGVPIFWGEVDRALACSEQLVDRLTQLLISEQIDLVYAPSPWEIHPDHRQASRLATESIQRTDGFCRMAFYEVGAALRPNVLLDITSDVSLKQRAMACFESQLEYQNYDEHIAALNRFRSYTLPATVKAAEAFLLMSAQELASFTVWPHWGEATGSSGPAPEALRPAAPLVSVLVRSTDSRYLQEALDSIAFQTWPHLEVVVVAEVPDHSRLEQRCGPHALRLISAQAPLSRAASGQLALQEAQGEYLLFLDEDDWLFPGHVARLVGVLEHQPHLLAAYTGVALVRPDGSALGKILDLPWDVSTQQTDTLLPMHSVLFKSSALQQGLSFDLSLDLQADRDFWMRLAHMAVWVHLPGVSAACRTYADLPDDASQSPRACTYSGLEQELLDLRAELAHQISLRKDATAMLAQASLSLQEQAKAGAANEAVLNQVLTSRSWRLTRPLRWVATWLRR
jgi:LmbE family N-acetylglucosaminyl deacetylase